MQYVGPSSMASDDELLQLLARREAVSTKLAGVMRLVMLAADEMLASGEIPPEDPEFAVLAPKAEALGLATHVGAACSVGTYERKAEEYAAAPGGEAVAEAMRSQAASAAALAEQAGEYAAFMRRVGGAPPSDSGSGSAASPAAARPSIVRPRRPNAKYFGPQWKN